MAVRRTRVAAPSWRDAADDGAAGGSGSHGRAPAVALGTRLQAALGRSLAIALWGALALALVLGLVNCAQTTTAGSPPPRPEPVPAPVAPPGGCAELTVASWVAGDAGTLAGPSRQDGPVREAAQTFTAAVTRAATPDAWGYLVGARVRERDEDGIWQDVGLQFFAVTMVDTGAGCQGWSPAALPMQVPAPSLAIAAPEQFPVTLPSSTTALADTLEAFFAGLLTGAGGVDRYLAPGVSIPPVQPPPYPDVQVAEIRAASGTPAARSGQVPSDGTAARLLVTVVADGAPLPLAYPVTVAVRDGRWEVVAIDPLVGTEPWQPAPQDTAGVPATPASPRN